MIIDLITPRVDIQWGKSDKLVCRNRILNVGSNTLNLPGDEGFKIYMLLFVKEVEKMARRINGLMKMLRSAGNKKCYVWAFSSSGQHKVQFTTHDKIYIISNTPMRPLLTKRVGHFFARSVLNAPNSSFFKPHLLPVKSCGNTTRSILIMMAVG